MFLYFVVTNFISFALFQLYFADLGVLLWAIGKRRKRGVRFMIRIAVVDDDKIALNQICVLINESMKEETKLESFQSGASFLAEMHKQVYDIVFLDIDTPEMNGFQIAETLKYAKQDITIIFVSNLEHLVFQSFEFKPFRFVRKNCLAKDIHSAVNAYQNELEKKRSVFFFKTNDADRSLAISEILYFESIGHDIFMQTIDLKYKLKRNRENDISIKAIEKILESKGFIRVHKSYLVNYRHIYAINRSNIILKNDIEIRINPHRVKEIKTIYQKFLMMEI